VSRSLKHVTYAVARRIVVVVVGTTLVAVGVVLLFTPGPAVVVLGLALAVFAVEFAWARRWLRKLKQSANSLVPTAWRSQKDEPRQKDELPPS
jgi:tellurite resistance protein TerC